MHSMPATPTPRNGRGVGLGLLLRILPQNLDRTLRVLGEDNSSRLRFSFANVYILINNIRCTIDVDQILSRRMRVDRSFVAAREKQPRIVSSLAEPRQRGQKNTTD